MEKTGHLMLKFKELKTKGARKKSNCQKKFQCQKKKMQGYVIFKKSNKDN